MNRPLSNRPQAIGQLALHQLFGLNVPLPAVQSFIVQGARKTEIEEGFIRELYSPQWTPEPTPVGHLRFALKHESFDLRVIYAALEAMDKAELEDWVRAEPTGAYARRAWYLYEHFGGQTLDLGDVKAGNYVEVLDKKRHFTKTILQRSSRHRILDNLLGVSRFCPFVRRTARLERMQQLGLQQKARILTEQYDPETLARAVNFLYTKETRSSFAIEGETPGPSRTERFVQALRRAGEFDPARKEYLIQLQGSIVDPRYAAKDWRDFQNFVGETTRHGQNVHFICPRPEDLPDLMQGWMGMNPQLYNLEDAIVAAAVSAFAFVFIHPFEDGNGRIHRFMIHHFLTKTQFSPPGIIFPVSAAILRDMRLYDEVLENFSRPLFEFIEWGFTEGDAIVVHNDTRNLYRFFDATTQAEYLYDRVKETIEVDLREELDFLAVFDRAMEAVGETVDMPDRKASLFTRLCLQNGGKLSKAKRELFSELKDDEIKAMEAAVQAAMNAGE